MKHFLLTFLIALTATVSSNAQTLQVDPILQRGEATFEIQNGTPGAKSILMISTQGPGPISLPQLGVVIDLTPPIQNLPVENVDALGFSYNTRSYSVPANVLIGRQIWFQGIQLDVRSSTPFTVTNMVPITVTGVANDAPLAVDDNAGVMTNSLVFIDVLANDSDPDGDAISLVSVNTPTHGTALIVSGQIEYTPLTGYVGADSFTYIIEDVFAAQATATVFVDVISTSGSLVSWGSDGFGQVSNTPTTSDFIYVSAGNWHSVALRSDGSLVSWGRNSYGSVIHTPTTNDFTQVAAGYGHSVALKSDGSLASWGLGFNGQVSNTPTTNDFIQVAAGYYHSVALRSDGSLVSWGYDGVGQVSNTPTTNDFIQVAGGYEHSVALRSDGSLVSWGSDSYGQVSNTPTTNDFIQVAAGRYHSVALRSDGSLVSWGDDSENQVSDTPTTNDFIQVAGGGDRSVALISDGSLVSWGRDYLGSVSNTPTTNDFTQVAAGGYHSVALKW
jgi:alpha-tubulin suppressor-like RCC1 family protein